MKLVTADEMRELDRRTIEEYEVPGDELMDRAGQGVADVVRRLSETSGFIGPRVLLLAGRGNNGGDAFTAARYLKEGGCQVAVWLAGLANQVKGDAFKHLSRLKSAGVELRELPMREDWEDALAAPVAAEVLVDGLLGTGSRGPARGPVVGAIEYINANATDALVVAIDIPSGLDADTGQPLGDAVRADVTVTMALPKRGLVQPLALDHVGAVEVVDIGIPGEFLDGMTLQEQAEMVYATDLRRVFKRRPRASHKGQYGHALLLGGGRGYTGAITLAARAALRSGVGLVSVVTPESVAGQVAGQALEAMVHGAPETEAGYLEGELPAAWQERLQRFDAVLVGPGLGRHPEGRRLVETLLQKVTRPLVLDADALVALAGEPGRLRDAAGPVVLTPHPGEMALLAGSTVAEVQADRRAAADDMAQRTGATVMLKGAGTIIAEAGRAPWINMTGNPGMATGGAGDVLAGLLAGLLAQGLEPFTCASAAAYLHGRAGDMATWRKSQAGVVAGDLVDELPYVFRDVTLR